MALIGSSSNDDPVSEIEVFFSKPSAPIPAIRIFPNPASTYTTISLSRNYSKSPSTLLIKNMYNSTLRKLNITENEVLIHLNGFSKGIYFIEVHTNEHILTQKLIIQ